MVANFINSSTHQLINSSTQIIMVPDTKMTVSGLTADERKKTVALYRVDDDFQAHDDDAFIIAPFAGVCMVNKDGVYTASFAVEYLNSQEGTIGNICNRIMARGYNVAVVGENNDDITDYYPACELEFDYKLSYDGANVIYTHESGRELVHYPFSQYRRGEVNSAVIHIKYYKMQFDFL